MSAQSFKQRTTRTSHPTDKPSMNPRQTFSWPQVAAIYDRFPDTCKGSFYKTYPAARLLNREQNYPLCDAIRFRVSHQVQVWFVHCRICRSIRQIINFLFLFGLLFGIRPIRDCVVDLCFLLRKTWSHGLSAAHTQDTEEHPERAV